MPLFDKSLRSFAAFRAGAPALFRACAANERLDRRALGALQVERLKSLLAHAGGTTSFWRRRFARFGIHPELVRSIRDLAALPPLDARDRRDFARDLVAGEAPGTDWIEAPPLPGQPGDAPAAPIWLDPLTRRERQVDELRHVGWMGLDWRLPRLELTGRADHGTLLPHAAGTLRGALRGGAWLHPAQLEPGADDGAAAGLAARGAKLGAGLLCGAPSALLRYAADAPANGWKPRAVQSSGEGLGEERRARLEAALGAPVFDAWRTRELGEAAHECDARNGLHVSMERVLIEVLRDGQPMPDGEDGELVATVLDNRSYPMFRVKTGDVGCRIPEPTCACGRTSERLLLTDGRSDELVTSPAGRRIHGDWFEWLLDTIVEVPDAPAIADWRVLQTRPDALVFEVHPVAEWNEAAQARLQAALVAGLQEVDPTLSLELQAVDTIPRRADGRRRAVVSNVPLTWDVLPVTTLETEPALAGPRA